MTVRLLAVSIALFLFALPAAAQPKPPALTFQTAPPGKILDDFKAIARQIGGDAAVQEVEKAIKEKFGDDGILGLDVLRPVLGYSQLTETSISSGAIVVVPITTEEQFLALLKRAGYESEAVKDDKGFYKLTPKAEVKNPPTFVRFVGKDAYLAANLPAEALAVKGLIAPKDLEIPSERALIAYRLHLTRIPEGLRKEGFEAFDKFVEQLKEFPGAGAVEDFSKVAGEAFAKLTKRLGDQVLKEGDILAMRVRVDVPTAEAGLEVALSPRKDTALAKDLAARKPTSNRFAGIVGQDAAAGLKVRLPLFTPELRTILAGGLEAARKGAIETGDAANKASTEELFQGLIRAAKGGEIDLAAALAGPDKNEHFTAVLAFSFDDPTKLDKAMRDQIKAFPEEIRKFVRLDAAKENGVALHEADFGGLVPPEAKVVFGDQAVLCVGLGPKAIYLAFGPDARKAVSAAVKLEPAEAPVLDLSLNPARLTKLIAAVDAEKGKKFTDAIGTKDAPLSAFSLNVEGGDELRVRVALNLSLFPRWFLAEGK